MKCCPLSAKEHVEHLTFYSSSGFHGCYQSHTCRAMKANILAQQFTMIRDNRKSFISIVKFANVRKEEEKRREEKRREEKRREEKKRKEKKRKEKKRKKQVAISGLVNTHCNLHSLAGDGCHSEKESPKVGTAKIPTHSRPLEGENKSMFSVC